MSTFLPSPTRHSRDRRESSKLAAADVNQARRADNKGDSPAAEMSVVVSTQGDVRQNAWRGEARRCSQSGTNNNNNGALHADGRHRHHDSRGNGSVSHDDPEQVAEKFDAWLAVVEKSQGQLTTANQADLCLWFHEERLAAKTPFAAVVPCPASLRTEKARQNVMNAIDNFAFPTFYVQTLPMGAKLSEVAQAFVRTPAHLPEAVRYRSGEDKGKYEYTTVACHNGRDAIDLVSRYTRLQDAVRDVPCLLLNDFCPLTPLCLRCLVVAGRCVAAEVACDEAYTPLFGIRPNTGKDGQGGSSVDDDDDFLGCEHTTLGERRRAAAAARRRDAPADDRAEAGDYRTASDVIAFGLQRFVAETLGASLAGRSYTALIAAEVKGFDPRVLGPRECDPPFWPVMTNEPLHLKPSPFDEAGLRFYSLSFDYADPTPFEAFAPQELHTIGDYVVAREADGVSLPPILRFLDGHEAERAAAHPPPAWTASAAAPPPHRAESVVEDTSSTVSSRSRTEKVERPRAADKAAAEEKPTRTSSRQHRDRTSAKPEQAPSPVTTAPIVLEPRDGENRNRKDTAGAGKKVNPADVDDVSSTVSGDTRASSRSSSSRLPSRTSSFHRPKQTAASPDAAERPPTSHVDASVRSYSTTSSALPQRQPRNGAVPERAARTSSEASTATKRDGSASLDRSETESSVSSRSSRLPERRGSATTTASSVASSQRSSVARADDYVTETESVRSSLPPRRRSTAAAAATNNGVVARAADAAASSASSRSSHTESVKTSPRDASEQQSIASSRKPAVAAVEQAKNERAAPQLPSPLRPEDIPVVPSPVFAPSEKSDAASSIASSATPSARSSHSRTRASEHPSSAHASSRRGAPSIDGTPEKAVSPSKSATSSVTRSVLMSSAAPSHRTATAAEATEAEQPVETASVHSSVPASSHTCTSAVPPTREPEALQYEDDERADLEEEEEEARDVQTPSVKSSEAREESALRTCHSSISVKDRDDVASAYSSSYVSTRSAGSEKKRPNLPPSILKDETPCIPSSMRTPPASERESVVPASVHSSNVAAPSEKSAPSTVKSRSVTSSAVPSVKPTPLRPDSELADNEDASEVQSSHTSELYSAVEAEESSEAPPSEVASEAPSSTAHKSTHSVPKEAATSCHASASQRSSRPATSVAASSHRSAVPSIFKDETPFIPPATRTNPASERESAVPASLRSSKVAALSEKSAASTAKSRSAASSVVLSVKPTPLRPDSESNDARNAQVVDASELDSHTSELYSAVEAEESSEAPPSKVASSAAHSSTPSALKEAATASRASASQRSSRPAPSAAASSHRSAVPSIPKQPTEEVSAVASTKPSSAAPSIKSIPVRPPSEAKEASVERGWSEAPSSAVAESHHIDDDLDATSSVSQPHASSKRSTNHERAASSAAATPSQKSSQKSSHVSARGEEEPQGEEEVQSEMRSQVPSVTNSWSTRSGARPAADAASSAGAQVVGSERSVPSAPRSQAEKAPSQRSSVRSKSSAAPAAAPKSVSPSASVRSRASAAASHADEVRSEVPDAMEFLRSLPAAPAATDSAVAAAETPVKSLHATSSSSSSSSAASSAAKSSAGAAPSQSSQHTSSRVPSHTVAASAPSPPAGEEEEDEAERSQTSRGGSDYFRGDEDASAMSVVVVEEIVTEAVEDVDVDPSAHEAAAEEEEEEEGAEEEVAEHEGAAEPISEHSSEPAPKEEEEEKEADGAYPESETEESLVASAHSIFEDTQEPAPQEKSPASSESASAHEVADLADIPASEVESAGHSNNGSSHTGGAQSQLYPINSADFQSCLSASAVSSQSTAMRRWVSGPNSEVNYPPSHASHASWRGAAPSAVAEVPAPVVQQSEKAASHTPSVRSTRSKKSAQSDEKAAAAKSGTASRHSSATPSVSAKAAPAGDAEEAQSEMEDNASAVGSAAAAPTTLQPSAEVPSEHDVTRPFDEASDAASSTGRRNASTHAAVEAVPTVDAAINTEAADEPASGSAIAGAAAGGPCEDRDEALRKARLRAMAAVIIANAAYEEVQRVAAMFKPA